jgi:hypothetical protein
MVRCAETLLMRLFRVFIRAQSEFLFRCYSDPDIDRSAPSPRLLSRPREFSVCPPMLQKIGRSLVPARKRKGLGAMPLR